MNKNSRAILFNILALLLLILGSCIEPKKVMAKDNIKMRVGIVDNALPCSDYNGENYMGSAVELWRAVAETNKIEYDLMTISDPNTAVKKAEKGDIDIAISCLNIISQRLDKIQFSVPYQSDSLAFLSRVKDKTRILDIFAEIFTSEIIITSLLMLYGITLVASVCLWRFSKGFKNKDVQCKKTLDTFLKGWMMLAIGGGIYKLADNPQNMSIIAIVNITRLVMSSVLVGTIASIIFHREIPEDGSTGLFLKESIKEIIAVDKGTISEIWIKNEAKKHQAMSNNSIVPISGDNLLIEALVSKKVGSILADNQRIILLKKLMGQNEEYHIAANTFNETPQAFIFGRDLMNDKRKQINIGIARLMFSGKVDEIQKRWD